MYAKPVLLTFSMRILSTETDAARVEHGDQRSRLITI